MSDNGDQAKNTECMDCQGAMTQIGHVQFHEELSEAEMAIVYIDDYGYVDVPIYGNPPNYDEEKDIVCRASRNTASSTPTRAELCTTAQRSTRRKRARWKLGACG
jgi:coenzyme F420-reducing hydrogenase gamma subunit